VGRAGGRGDCVGAWSSDARGACLWRDDGRPFLPSLLAFGKCAPTGLEQAKQALALPMPGLGEALQAASALAWRAEVIVTRNLPDYRHSPVPAISPAQALQGPLKL